MPASRARFFGPSIARLLVASAMSSKSSPRAANSMSLSDHEEAVKVEDGAGAGGKERVVVETRDAAADQKESPLSPTRVLSGSPPPLLASSPHHLDHPPLPDLS